ncbi:MAG: hypothetical protein JW993_08080 [Sedimentisphaerales bacterium]|nr:hypothetical protein [Sedimentisphaerales bacterium]
MKTSKGRSWPDAGGLGRILPIVLALLIGAAQGADRITGPGTNNSTSPTVRPAPPQQVRPAPGFRPAQPMLQTPASFTPDMPIERAIQILRYSTQPPLNVVVLWRDLEENAGIDKTTPIGIDGLQGVRLRQCLESLLTSLSATAPTAVTYVVNHGVITIGTIEALPKPKRVTRVYDISDLVAPPSTGMGFGMMGGMMPGMMPGMMGGMMPGYGGMLGGYGMGAGGYSPGYGGYSPGYGGYGGYGTSGYNALGGFPGFMSTTQGGGYYAR